MSEVKNCSQCLAKEVCIYLINSSVALASASISVNFPQPCSQDKTGQIKNRISLSVKRAFISALHYEFAEICTNYVAQKN